MQGKRETLDARCSVHRFPHATLLHHSCPAAPRGSRQSWLEPRIPANCAIRVLSLSLLRYITLGARGSLAPQVVGGHSQGGHSQVAAGNGRVSDNESCHEVSAVRIRDYTAGETSVRSQEECGCMGYREVLRSRWPRVILNAHITKGARYPCCRIGFGSS